MRAVHQKNVTNGKNVTSLLPPNELPDSQVLGCAGGEVEPCRTCQSVAKNTDSAALEAFSVSSSGLSPMD